MSTKSSQLSCKVVNLTDLERLPAVARGDLPDHLVDAVDHRLGPAAGAVALLPQQRVLGEKKQLIVLLVQAMDRSVARWAISSRQI